MAPTLADFRKYYDSDLRPLLETFEERRRGIVRNLAIAGGAVALLFLGAAGIMLASGVALHLLLIPLVIGGLILGLVYWWQTKDFVAEFKKNVIQRVVGFFDENLRYHPDRHISRGQFSESQIFLHRIDRFRGEDLVQGHIGKTAVAFSEVHAEHKKERRDSKGRRRTEWHTIFKGLFFEADFNKEFARLTLVLPDVAEKTLGKWLGQMLQSANISRPQELIKLEDPEFEKQFVVYGDDQVEARYILSTSLMRRICAFQEKTGKPVHLSFHRSRVSVAVTTGRDMFEPRIFRSLLDFEMCREFFEDLEMAAGIVEDLNLNTRIWTKE